MSITDKSTISMVNKKENYGFASEMACKSGRHWMTMFTPTYQRATTMPRLYQSLLSLRKFNRGG